MNLNYNIMSAHLDCDETRHAQTVMAELGITYKLSTPQSLYDCWWFWCCEGVPDPLPKYLTVLKVNPRDAIGNGLTVEDVALIEGESDETMDSEAERRFRPKG